MTVHRIRHDPVAIGAGDHLGRALRDLAWSADNGAELRLNPVMAKALHAKVEDTQVELGDLRIVLQAVRENFKEARESFKKVKEELVRLKNEPVAGDD